MTSSTADDRSADRLLENLREEYESLAGLRLTLNQVARLVGVDHECAADLLKQLEVEGLVSEAPGGIYRRSEPLRA
jgi:DNA-binding IclR family transcriptional regulator